MNQENITPFVQTRFNEAVEYLETMSSYQDVNILCKSTRSTTKGNLMILKIFYSRPYRSESDFKKQLEYKIDCVCHLRKEGFKCSEFVLGVDDHFVQDFKEERDGREDEHSAAVLYSFLPGKELEHSGYVHHPAVLFEVGAFLGCFHEVFRGLDHDSSLEASKDDPWLGANYKLLAGDCYMDVVQDAAMREKLTSLLEYVNTVFEPAKGTLRKGILHGDFQGMNVIVSEDFKVNSRTVKVLPRSQRSTESANSSYCRSSPLNSNANIEQQGGAVNEYHPSMPANCSNCSTSPVNSNANIEQQEGAVDESHPSMPANSSKCRSSPVNSNANIEQQGGAVDESPHPSMPVLHQSNTTPLTLFKQISIDPQPLLKTFALIDFEDVHYSYTVFEVGRVIADAMSTLLAKSLSDDSTHNNSTCNSGSLSSTNSSESLSLLLRSGQRDFVENKRQTQASLVFETAMKSELLNLGGYIICGYLATREMTATEYDLIWATVLVSLCQYYVLGTQAMQENPSNSEYVGYCTREAQMLIDWFHSLDPKEVYQRWSRVAQELMADLMQD